MDHCFVELVRASVGNLNQLSCTPSDIEWETIYDMVMKQSLVGVCFAGLQNLGADADEGFAQIGMSEDLYLEWMGMAAQISMKNETVNQQCAVLQDRLSAEGFRSSILKGQGVATLYGEELSSFRQSGDIDVYVDCGREKAIVFARSIQGDVEWDYKHLHLNIFPDTEVEVHYVPEILMNLRKNKRLQKWFAKPEVQDMVFQKSGNLVTPSVEFNLFYILLHTYRHFLYEGVGMRQLMDYYFVLKSAPAGARVATLKLLDEFGMMRFARGVMWIMKEVFGLSEEYLICDVDEKEGKYILGEVMEGGNFGQHDERLKDGPSGKIGAVLNVLKHNCHILLHYPGEALWAPVWVVYHWCWKRLQRI